MSGSIALSLLQAAYGTTSADTTSYSNPVTALTEAEATQTQQIAAEARQPSVARTISAFTAAVRNATDPATLLQNPTVLTVLLTVNGLGDQTAYPALARQALLSDPSDSSSLASHLSSTNSAWGSAASTYQFATKGLSVIQQSSVLSAISQGYAEVLWRQSLDATTPGLSNALTFIATASSATSVDAVLGDATLRTVVTTALGIPAQIAYQDLGAQEQAVGSRLDVTRLRDPTFVQNMAKLYLLQTQSNGTGSGAPSLDQLAVSAAGLVV
jgi:hypothetical protein